MTKEIKFLFKRTAKGRKQGPKNKTLSDQDRLGSKVGASALMGPREESVTSFRPGADGPRGGGATRFGPSATESARMGDAGLPLGAQLARDTASGTVPVFALHKDDSVGGGQPGAALTEKVPARVTRFALADGAGPAVAVRTVPAPVLERPSVAFADAPAEDGTEPGPLWATPARPKSAAATPQRMHVADGAAPASPAMFVGDEPATVGREAASRQRPQEFRGWVADAEPDGAGRGAHSPLPGPTAPGPVAESLGSAHLSGRVARAIPGSRVEFSGRRTSSSSKELRSVRGSEEAVAQARVAGGRLARTTSSSLAERIGRGLFPPSAGPWGRVAPTLFIPECTPLDVPSTPSPTGSRRLRGSVDAASMPGTPHRGSSVSGRSLSRRASDRGLRPQRSLYESPVGRPVSRFRTSESLHEASPGATARLPSWREDRAGSAVGEAAFGAEGKGLAHADGGARDVRPAPTARVDAEGLAASGWDLSELAGVRRNTVVPAGPVMEDWFQRPGKESSAVGRDDSGGLETGKRVKADRAARESGYSDTAPSVSEVSRTSGSRFSFAGDFGELTEIQDEVSAGSQRRSVASMTLPLPACALTSAVD